MGVMRTARRAWWTVSALALSMGCGGAVPSRPTEATAAPRAGDAGAVTSLSEDNDPPSAVFRTTPRADSSGVIPGRLPLEVTFNTCPSSDVDPGDRLKTTYDFDGDGIVDLAGHCRTTYTFDASARPRVCVADRQPDHEVCKSYEVGRPPSDLTCIPKGARWINEAEPNGWGMTGPGPFTPMRLRFGSARIAGSIKRDGDDYFVMDANPCDAPVVVEVRVHGGDGPEDCAADPRSTLQLAVGGQEFGDFFSEATRFSGTACSGPLSVRVAPGHPMPILHAGMFPPFQADYPDVTYAPERYVLEIRVTPDR
jgi:hypothetical protein